MLGLLLVETGDLIHIIGYLLSQTVHNINIYATSIVILLFRGTRPTLSDKLHLVEVFHEIYKEGVVIAKYIRW